MNNNLCRRVKMEADPVWRREKRKHKSMSLTVFVWAYVKTTWEKWWCATRHQYWWDDITYNIQYKHWESCFLQDVTLLYLRNIKVKAASQTLEIKKKRSDLWPIQVRLRKKCWAVLWCYVDNSPFKYQPIVHVSLIIWLNNTLLNSLDTQQYSH